MLLRPAFIAVLCGVGAGGATCMRDTDCELNGQCQGGECRCFPGWTGPTCGTLKLKPAPVLTAGGPAYALYPMARPLPPHHEGPASEFTMPPRPSAPISWGGTVLVEDGVYHLFVDVVCYSPSTIMHDRNGAQTVHATSNHPFNETFVFRDVALPPQHDCPHITKARDGTYLMFNTGQGMDCPTTCTGGPSKAIHSLVPVNNTERPCRGTGFFGLNVASSKNLFGPWTLHDNLPINGYGQPIEKQSNVNPSPLILDNGTVIVAYTDAANGEQIGLARTDNPTTGPYTKLGPPGKPIFDHHCEDPYVFKGRSGYHVICHDMEADRKASPLATNESNGCRFQGYDPKLGPPQNENCTGEVGLHAFAMSIEGDGSGWATAKRLVGNASEPSAFSSRVAFTDGTVFNFFRRERPELRTNAAGDPTHLISGIEYFADHPEAADNHQYSFTIVQEVDLTDGFIPGEAGDGVGCPA